MAKDKPKKSDAPKKPADKPETPKDLKPAKDLKENTKEVKETKDTKEVKEAKDAKDTKPAATVAKPAVALDATAHPLKGLFAKKCDKDENILTIFKTPKIWGAVMGEAIGTMFVVMFLLTLGLQNPIYVPIALIGVYVAVVGLSGAHLNPLITAGMMATRRVSAIRGVLYMLAQLLGAWIGLIIINAFRLDSGTTYELPIMAEITGETFWAVALIELLGAVVLAFSFARALRYARKQPLTFALTVTCAIALVSVFGYVVASGFFGFSTSYIFNPVAALMYQILPTAANDIGELAGMVGLAVAAYIIIPVIGGILGFIISDIATRLSCGGYFCKCDEECDCCCCASDNRKQ